MFLLNWFFLAAAVVIFSALCRHLLQPDFQAKVRGKRCLVTGASLGIGKELARELAVLGASEIVVVARSEDKLSALRREILALVSDTGNSIPNIHVIPADLSTEKACSDVIELSLDKMGGIDFLVLNHITNSAYGLWSSKENFDFVSKMYNVNTLSYIWLASASLSAIQDSGGQVVVVSSLAGWVGVPNTALYASTKHALRGFFNALRTELELYNKNNTVGITICNIGAVDTEGSKEVQGRIDTEWIDARSVSRAIIRGAALRHREIYFPFVVYPTIILHFFFPQLVEKILHMTMH